MVLNGATEAILRAALNHAPHETIEVYLSDPTVSRHWARLVWLEMPDVWKATEDHNARRCRERTCGRSWGRDRHGTGNGAPHQCECTNRPWLWISTRLTVQDHLVFVLVVVVCANLVGAFQLMCQIIAD